MSDSLTIAQRRTSCRSTKPGLPGSVGYHIRCRHCEATTICPIEEDAPRMVCSGCGRLLVIPVTVMAECPDCRAVESYPHTLAGHSTQCAACGRVLTVDAVVGVATQRPVQGRHRHSRSRSHSRRSVPSSPRRREAIGYFLIIMITASLATIFMLLMGL